MLLLNRLPAVIGYPHPDASFTQNNPTEAGCAKIKPAKSCFWYFAGLFLTKIKLVR